MREMLFLRVSLVDQVVLLTMETTISAASKDKFTVTNDQVYIQLMGRASRGL